MSKLEPDNLIDPNLSVSTAVSPTNDQTTILAQPDQGKDVEVVSGHFVPDIAVNAGYTDAQRNAARLRQTIETFNEDRQTPLEWLVVKFFTVLAYILPPFVAWVVGT